MQTLLMQHNKPLQDKISECCDSDDWKVRHFASRVCAIESVFITAALAALDTAAGVFLTLRAAAHGAQNDELNSMAIRYLQPCQDIIPLRSLFRVFNPETFINRNLCPTTISKQISRKLNELINEQRASKDFFSRSILSRLTASLQVVANIITKSVELLFGLLAGLAATLFSFAQSDKLNCFALTYLRSGCSVIAAPFLGIISLLNPSICKNFEDIYSFSIHKGNNS